jgi:type I restriction enzyme S subunit
MIKCDIYKPSGIDWLGDIPNDWEFKRLKDFGSFQNGVSKGKEYFGFGCPFVSYGNVYNNTISIDKIDKLANSNKEEQKLYSVREGDVFFTRTSETIDEIGIASTCQSTIETATFSGFVIRFRQNGKVLSKEFSNYFFKANSNRLFLSNEINIVTRASLSQGVLGNLPVLIPSKKEQATIANYLDTKVQALDKKISLLTQKANYYKEYRKSIINETVCKGLDKTVKLKDSGIDWIGQIPKHWEVKRLKDSFKLFTGNSISDKGLYEDINNSIDYIATKDIDFETGKLKYDNGIYIPIGNKEFKIAKKHSILICLEGASAGKKIGFTDRDVCFVNKLCSIKSFSKNSNDKYLYYFTQSPLFEKQFFAILNGLIGGVALSLIKYFDVVKPTLKEQTEIATYLDNKTQTIDKIVNNINTQIATLKELRKTLINDVVTGKIKVC